MPQLYPSGIKKLDDALHGGLPKPANFLLIGPPMSNKTEIGMHLLNGGLQLKEAAIYISTSNTAEEIRSRWIEHGLEPVWEQEGRVKFIDCYSRMLGITEPDTQSIRRVPSILDYSKLTVAVNEWCSNYNIKKLGVRIVLDTLSSFLIYSSLQTVMRFLHIFFGQLRKQNVLGLFLVDEGTHEPITINQLKTFANGAFVLDQNSLRLEAPLEKFGAQISIDSISEDLHQAVVT